MLFLECYTYSGQKLVFYERTSDKNLGNASKYKGAKSW